jgi:hypothetical protein
MPGFRLRAGSYPVAAADWILEHAPRGPLYNTNGIGGYLVWRLAPRSPGQRASVGASVGPPRWRVYSDGRMPMFYDALVLARDFSAVEARYAPQVLVVDWGHPLTTAHSCEGSPGFRERYALVHVSRGAKLYVRRGGPNQGLADRFGYRHLTYVGRFWPGRVVELRAPGGAVKRLQPLPPPADLPAFRREVERARREAPGLPFLPE